jgi:hypothetical protein
MYENPVENKKFEESLAKLSVNLHKIKGSANRFKFLTTYCQVIHNPVSLSLIEKGEKQLAMDYIQRFIPQIPVPPHYELLTKLGLCLEERSDVIYVISKEKKEKVLTIKNDPICSGSESLKLALVMAASHHDGEEYNVDFTIKKREENFNQFTMEHSIDMTYDNYCAGVGQEKTVGELKLVEVRDDNLEITTENIVVDCKTNELLSEDEVYQILEQVKEKCVVFQCRMKSGAEIHFDGIKVEKVNNVTRVFIPKPDSIFAPGPEHKQHVLGLRDFFVSLGKPVGKMFEYKPSISKNMLMARNRDAGVLVVDYTKKNNAEDSQKEILDIISGEKKLLSKYIEIRELYETHKGMIQAQPRFINQVDKTFEGPPAWRKKVSDLKQNSTGKTFNQFLIAGTRALKEFSLSPPYKAALASGKNLPVNMELSKCMDLFLDGMIKSPTHYPTMSRVGNQYRFNGPSLDNNKTAVKYNPHKDALQQNIDAGILDKLGQSPEANIDELKERLDRMNNATPEEDYTKYGDDHTEEYSVEDEVPPPPPMETHPSIQEESETDEDAEEDEGI